MLDNMKYVIFILKRNRSFYLHENGEDLTWMSTWAKRFDTYDEAEVVAKSLTRAWDSAKVVIDFNLPSY